MKDAITSRLQLFLAKIAGRDVSESTLTPPVITNMEEKLLDEIANRMDAVEEAASSGGGGVITLDYDSLAQTEKIVDYMDSGDALENRSVFLYDIDLNSQYRLARQDGPSRIFYPQGITTVLAVDECLDTGAEDFELAETISGETILYEMSFNDSSICFAPTTTKFKTYKRASGK